jgi:ABC-type amino acid transport substrate-binding protein
MQRLTVSALIVAAAALSATAALACGDKLLAVGRGVRFQRANAAREANLVIYSATARSGAPLGNSKLQIALKSVVHKLQVVQGGSQLDQALKSGRVDVVLVEFGDLAGIARELQSAPSKPAILPILVKPSKAELTAVQKEYRFALKAGADDFEYLTAIDEAMKVKLRSNGKS